jgi:hypothetical protein
MFTLKEHRQDALLFSLSPFLLDSALLNVQQE